jgi:predicted nuclease with TOPRIM domain
MDQAAQALSNIFGGALDEIREELNELKQSKTALLKKNEALEAAHNNSARVITQLQGALRETHSLAQAALASHKSDNLLNQQLWERLKEVRETVESQRIANSHLSVSLAEARNEVAAVKLLLDAMGSDQM